jgi:hypothetical protein
MYKNGDKDGDKGGDKEGDEDIQLRVFYVISGLTV